MSKSSTPAFFSVVSPAARAAVIVGALFFGGLTLAGLWVGREAHRIKVERAMTHVANRNRATTGDMVWIPPGKFTMGGIGAQVPPDELPLHDVKLDGFWMDRTDVTNEEFARFVEATRYVTVAEIPVSSKTTPGLLPELEGKSVSLCFRPPKAGETVNDAYQWWEPRIGANWRHPGGEGTNLEGLEKHPVVHVCYKDAVAYCEWAGKRLPTEAEWEYAARGGLESQPYVWGSDFCPGGRWMANTWQGRFPEKNLVQDGWAGTSPVGSFPPNGYGLVDMAGNVWQITADWYRPDYYSTLVSAGNSNWEALRNPKGPSESFDPDEPNTPKKVTRGGSFMCSDNYCRGYRPSARMKTAPDTGLQNTGFRCVKDAGRE